MKATEESSERKTIRKQVQEILRAQDAFSLSGSLGLFLRGLGVCAVMGIVVATVLTVVFSSFTETIGWFRWFLIYWLLLVPTLIWSERKRRPNYVITSLSTTGPQASSAADELAKDASAPAGYNRVLTWGPRALLDGLASVRGKPTPKKGAVLKRAAQMVLELAKFNGGVEIRALMHPPENMIAFNEAVDWLDAHDYLGKSSDGERMWITSIGRDKLLANGVTLKMASV